MREYKFRAFRKGKMHQGANLFQMLDVASKTGYDSAKEEKDLVVMQYTGLKDKNGVEIYEGDILKFCHEDYYDHENETFYESNEENGIGQVKWGVSYPAFDIYTLSNANVPAHECEYNIFSGENHYMEVIGNIYENPELLKEKQ